MKKAFSMIELIVSMLILAFVFAAVSMIVKSTSNSTKEILTQDRSIKLQELFAVLNTLPYGSAINQDEVYSKTIPYKFEAQDRAVNQEFANEMLGNSDKYIIKASNSNLDSRNYINLNPNNELTINEVYNFYNGERNIKFTPNSFSSSLQEDGKAKIKWNAKATTVSNLNDGNIALLKLTIFSPSNPDNETILYSYFSNTGRKESGFYIEKLPFNDEGDIAKDNYIKEINDANIK